MREALQMFSVGSPYAMLLNYTMFVLVYTFFKSWNKVLDVVFFITGITFSTYGIGIIATECSMTAGEIEKSIAFTVTAAVMAAAHILFGVYVAADRWTER